MSKIITRNSNIVATPDGKAMTASWPVISGTLDIDSLGAKDVTNYEYAQIVDDNLSAENIADGVTILGVEGTHKGAEDVKNAVKVKAKAASGTIDSTTMITLQEDGWLGGLTISGINTSYAISVSYLTSDTAAVFALSNTSMDGYCIFLVQKTNNGIELLQKLSLTSLDTSGAPSNFGGHMKKITTFNGDRICAVVWPMGQTYIKLYTFSFDNNTLTLDKNVSIPMLSTYGTCYSINLTPGGSDGVFIEAIYLSTDYSTRFIHAYFYSNQMV